MKQKKLQKGIKNNKKVVEKRKKKIHNIDDITDAHIKDLPEEDLLEVKKIIITTDSKIFCGVCNTPVEKMKLRCGCKINYDSKIIQ